MAKSFLPLHRAHLAQPANGLFTSAAKLSLRKLKRSLVTALPRSAVMSVAQPAALFWTLATPGGRHTASYMQSAYTLGRLSGVRTATRWKAYKFREAVIAVRLEEEKERIADWPVVHHNSGPYLELARQGKPFILVTGHFAPLAGYGSLNTFPVASVTIAHGIPGELSLVQQRIVDYPTSTGANVRFVLVGEAGLPAIVARQLTTPGTMIVLTIDVRNNHKPHWRPFAGYASYPCHPYAARLARLAQCPVVFNNVTWDKSGRVRVEWSNLFDPPARHDQAAETALTDALFDELEAAIGRHPTQYAWTTGFDRYWDSQAGRWRNHGSA